MDFLPQLPSPHTEKMSDFPVTFYGHAEPSENLDSSPEWMEKAHFHMLMSIQAVAKDKKEWSIGFQCRFRTTKYAHYYQNTVCAWLASCNLGDWQSGCLTKENDQYLFVWQSPDKKSQKKRK